MPLPRDNYSTTRIVRYRTRPALCIGTTTCSNNRRRKSAPIRIVSHSPLKESSSDYHERALDKSVHPSFTSHSKCLAQLSSTSFKIPPPSPHWATTLMDQLHLLSHHAQVLHQTGLFLLLLLNRRGSPRFPRRMYNFVETSLRQRSCKKHGDILLCTNYGF
ncbi:hypothetical protein BGX38DRAFT_585149 [Terfezia claveryi]|nr:hypothetical protein BGX38DRAFT_585149 [Terfezia claveryi]